MTLWITRGLPAPVILGCDKYVEKIRPKQGTVELDDGTKVLIIRTPFCKHPHVRLPDEQQWEHLYRRSTHVKVAKTVTIPPAPQVTVLVSTTRNGLLTIEQYPSMLTKIGCLAANGTMLCKPGRAFRVLFQIARSHCAPFSKPVEPRPRHTIK